MGCIKSSGTIKIQVQNDEKTKDLFESISLYNSALEDINEAIKIIPNQYNHILLENKLFYYAKQGKNFLQTMGVDSGSSSAGGPGGDKDVLTKAKLFQKLARSSLNKLDQFNHVKK